MEAEAPHRFPSPPTGATSQESGSKASIRNPAARFALGAVKRDCHSRRALSFRALNNIPQHMAMGAMNSVKVAHADQRRSKVFWDVCELVKDFHPAGRLKSQIPVSSRRSKAARWGEVVVRGFMRQIVCDMSEKCALWLTRSTIFSEFSTVECVGWGVCLNPSRNSRSKFSSWAKVSSGIELKSVRYAQEPKR